MSSPLKRLRVSRGLTTTAVAKAVGINQGQYSRIENGAKTTAETAQRIVEFFGRDAIDEVRVLYPERFPPATAPQQAAWTERKGQLG